MTNEEMLGRVGEKKSSGSSREIVDIRKSVGTLYASNPMLCDVRNTSRAADGKLNGGWKIDQMVIRYSLLTRYHYKRRLA